MDYLRINCDTGQYKVFIGYGILNQLNEFLDESFLDMKILIVTDQNVANLYLEKTLEILKNREVGYVIIPAGEESKNIDAMKCIYEKLLNDNYGRDSLIISLGGGVVGDVSGFVSATYMRGIPYVQIPTTIIAQVDSSIGGKVGINFGQYKNISGAFYHPKSVVIDLDFINTLDKQQYLSGLAEIIKYGLIEDYEFFKYISRNKEKLKLKDKEYLKEIIIKSLKIKKTVVEMDERDFGIRRILNFGHTIGHGLEGLNCFKRYTHGESVALGMIYESYLSYKMGLIEKKYFEEIFEILGFIIKPSKYNDLEIDQFYKALEKDKKKIGENLIFILPTDRGRVGIFKNIEKNIISDMLKSGIYN